MEKKERLLFSLDLENKRKRDQEVSEEDAQKKTCMYYCTIKRPPLMSK